MALFSIVLATVFAAAPADRTLSLWPEAARPAQLAYEEALIAGADPEKLRAWHDLLGSEPHIAGTDGDQRVIESLIQTFRSFGLEVERHDFWAYLAEPVEAALQIVASPADHAPAPGRRGVLDLSLKEDDLLDDPFVAHPGLSYGWNAYSGSGDVTGEVVYANYGTKEDFATLRERGVDCAGRIVVARYGRNFRGYKARFAEEAGAAGLIIYTDPADAGYGKGLTWPEGGWANDTCIQRGSIKTLPYAGDPLTPFIEATKDAPRLDPEQVELPRIPVQPVGWRAAQQILSRMRGRSVQDAGADWQGGLPLPYRLTGGPELQVRLKVVQKRSIVRSSNVIATLRGARDPDQWVIIGCHHDAWGYGAGDPLAGTILLLESARAFAELARKGHAPARTIIFAAWGAEEFGIVGSTEWVEGRREMLTDKAAAYINLDAAAMGPNFASNASPSLRTLIADAARRVPQARDPQRTVIDAWQKRGSEKAIAASETEFGDLGGGSDHISFLCHVGIPSCGLHGGGAPGTAYHSNYDNLAWYRQTVGEDYEPAMMLTRMLNVIAARLAAAPVLPLEPSRYAVETRRHLQSLARIAESRGVALTLDGLMSAIADFESKAKAAEAAWRAPAGDAAADAAAGARADRLLRRLERCWLLEEGLPGRPWFRNLYAASDPDSGYAAWILPGLRWAIQSDDPAAVESMAARVQAVFEHMSALLSGGQERGLTP
jgi:N-acetylated-alpha-linked acidic dipeptidase